MATSKSSKWQPGQSGNPQGRPPGSGSVAALRAQIGEHVPEIIGAMVECAKEGDVGAARLLLERVIPPLRPAGATPPMPDGVTADAVAQAVAAGDMNATEGAALLELQKACRGAKKMEELVARGPSKLERDIAALLGE